MKIVITGASGQYGSTAVERLLKRVPAEDLILITRRPERLAALTALGVDVRYGDYDDAASLVDAFRGGDRLMLISGTRVGKRIPQHKAAIDAAVACGLRHVVYTSFVGIRPGNPSEAVADHAATEEMIRASGLAWTMLRDAHYADAMIRDMGPNFIRSGQWLSSTAGGREALVWRDDCIDSAVAVLTGEGDENQVYNITGPELLSFAEIAAMLTELTGRAVRYSETDPEGMYALFDAMGIPREPVDNQSVAGISWNSNDMVTFEAAIREGYFAVISDDVERLTGRKARSVRQMIEDNLEMLRSA